MSVLERAVQPELLWLCWPQTSHSAFHTWEVTGSPKAGRAGSRPHTAALPPLLGRLVVAFSVSVTFSSSLPGFCFNLSVSEMQSTQRAYFYQRFPILHLEPGDCTWVASLVCGASRAVRQMLLLSFSYRWPFLPACPFPGLPLACGQAPPRRPIAVLL